jgi:fermentation-respiration switch protein FrsA (DUF1100 family)
MKTTLVSDTPIFWLEPNATQTRKLVIWLHGFTESREDVTDNLRDLAAAGLERRITAVAACIATPDWLKPGSIYELNAPNPTIQAQYNQHNPFTNLDRYQHCPAILLQCGAADPMVPADGAIRFVQALADTYQHSPHKLQVLLEEGVEHEMTATMWHNALNWFTRFLPVS